MANPGDGLIASLLGKFGERLKFPQLFGLLAALFLVDLVIPDLIPFADELLLMLLTLLVGSLKKDRSSGPSPPGGNPPQIKNVTPPGEG